MASVLDEELFSVALLPFGYPPNERRVPHRNAGELVETVRYIISRKADRPTTINLFEIQGNISTNVSVNS